MAIGDYELQVKWEGIGAEENTWTAESALPKQFTEDFWATEATYILDRRGEGENIQRNDGRMMGSHDDDSPSDLSSALLARQPLSISVEQLVHRDPPDGAFVL